MLLQIFKAILITSAAGSILTVLLLLLKPITKRCFGSVWQYYIWWTVLIVMMLPVTIRLPQVTPVSTQNLPLEIHQTITETTEQTETANIQHVQTPVIVDTKPSLEQRAINIFKNISLRITDVICYMWLFGLVLIFGINIIRYLIFLRVVRKNSVVVFCPEISTNKIITRKTNMIDAPLMLGIIIPVLLLPDMEMSEESLNCILLHEITHYKRHDLLYKWFVMIVNTVHWFNPFAYIVSKQIDEECEISCDLSVVANMNEQEQNGYMNTILTLLSANKAKKQILTTAMASNKNQIKRRFTMIRNATKKSKIIMLTSAIAACIILIGSVIASGVLNDKIQTQDLDQATENQTNILLIGVDGNNNADTLMLLSLNRVTNSLAALSIPRDTLITVDNQDTKISFLTAAADEQRIIDAVRNSIEIPVDYYARINFEGFRNIIDILGGVEFDVPIDMLYNDPAQDLNISLNKGLQILDGAKAEQLVRYRAGYPEGDIARVRMQQSFVAELIKQKYDVKYLTEISGLYNEISKNVTTNYSDLNMTEYMKLLSEINIEDIESFTLPGAVEAREGFSYFIVNDTELESLIKQHFAAR